jgi:hypothetical protein
MMVHQFYPILSPENFIPGNVPSLTTLLPFRGSITTMDISESLGRSGLTAVRASHVHVLPYNARNTILLRVSTSMHVAVASADVAGFTISERMANTEGVTKLDWCSLHYRIP